MEEHAPQKEHALHTNADTKLPMPKKILLYCLYSLLVLMIIFSLLSLRNLGKEGYQQCVEKKCEMKGEKFCSKLRELNTCCAGAGGTLAGVNNPQPGERPYTCIFD